MCLQSLLFTFLLLSLPFGNLTRISFSNQEINIYFPDLIIIFILFLNIKNIVEIIKNNRLLVGFISFSLFSLFLMTGDLSFIKLTISSLYLWRYLVYILFFLLLIKKGNSLLPVQFDHYLRICIELFLASSFFQYFFFPRLESLFASGWDRHAYRLVGTLFDANFTGLILVFCLLWLIKKIMLKKQLLIDYVIMFLSFIALLLTYSRSSYLALLAGLFVLLGKSKSYLIIATFVLLGLLLPLLPQRFGEGTKLLRTSTIFSRIYNIDLASQLVSKKPLFGWGFNTLRYEKNITKTWPPSHSAAGLDNSLLFVLATLGFAGLIQFYLFWKSILTNIKERVFFLSLAAAAIVHGMFTNSWFFIWILLWGSFFYTEIETSENKKQ